MKRQGKELHVFFQSETLSHCHTGSANRQKKWAFVSWTSVYYYAQKSKKKCSKQFYEVFVAGRWKSAKHWHARSTNVNCHRLLSYRKLLLQITDCTEYVKCFLSSKSWTSTLSNYRIENKNKNARNLKLSWILKVTLNFTKGVRINILLNRRKVDKSPDRQV